MVSAETLMNDPDWIIHFTLHTAAPDKPLGAVIVAPDSPLWWLPSFIQYKVFSLGGFGFNGYLLVSTCVLPPLNRFLVWFYLLVESLITLERSES